MKDKVLSILQRKHIYADFRLIDNCKVQKLKKNVNFSLNVINQACIAGFQKRA